MIFSIVLLVAFGIVWTVTRGRWDARTQWRHALAAGMAVAGLTHFISPLPFVQHMPEWVPVRYLIVYASGVFEIAIGLALFVTPRRLLSAIGAVLALYLVAVFPANVYVAVAGVDVVGQPGGLYPWLRLPFQALFVWLALWATGASVRVSVPRAPDRRSAAGRTTA